MSKSASEVGYPEIAERMVRSQLSMDAWTQIWMYRQSVKNQMPWRFLSHAVIGRRNPAWDWTRESTSNLE